MDQHKRETIARLRIISEQGSEAEQFVTGISYVGEDVSNVTLQGVKLQHIEFARTNFSGSNLSHSDLAGSSFSLAVLQETNLSGSNVSGCDFTGADLTDADLSNAAMSNAILDRAIILDTKLPDDMIVLDVHYVGPKGNSIRLVYHPEWWPKGFVWAKQYGAELPQFEHDVWSKYPGGVHRADYYRIITAFREQIWKHRQ